MEKDLMRILRSPLKAEIPQDYHSLNAMVDKLCTICDNKKRFIKIMGYADRLPVEFGFAFINGAVQRNNKFVKTPAFLDWCHKNSEFLLAGW